MKNTFIIYGPQGCGKTTNALDFAAHFGCDWIEDNWSPEMNLRPGALHLTSADLSEDCRGSRVPAYSFDEAMASMRVCGCTTAKISTNVINASKIRAGSGYFEEIPANSVSTSHIADVTFSSPGKPSNPKDGVGIRKWRQFVTVPFTVVAEVGAAMLEGGMKYARHNYRVAGVRASVYVDAAIGHVMQWWEGEDLDPDTKLSHITKAIASLVVLRDAMIQDMLNDDRPPKAKLDKVRADLQTVVDEMFDKYPESKAPVTEAEIRANHQATLARLMGSNL